MIDLAKLSPAPWESYVGLPCEIPTHGAGVTNRPAAGVILREGHAGDSILEIASWCPTVADAEFIALARNAFDVMMRRGWHAMPTTWDDEFVGLVGRWIVCSRPDDAAPNVMARCGFTVEERNRDWPDPFTALVEADRWYKEHVEKCPQPSP